MDHSRKGASAAVPGAVREAWGDTLVVEMVPWLQEMIREYGVPRDEYREVLSRLDSLERNVSQLDEKLFQTRIEFKEDLGQLRQEMNERFDRVNGRFDRVNGRFDRVNGRFDQMHERFDDIQHQMVVQTRWLVGSLTVIGTIVSVLLAIAQFTP